MLLPFNQSKQGSVFNNSRILLAADVGATKTNLALYKTEGEHDEVLHEANLKSKEFENVIQLVTHFMKGLPHPDAVCFGVAGPVLDGHAKLSNLSWEIDINELRTHFNIKSVHVINDLAATAYGLAVLSEKDMAVVHESNDTIPGNAAIIAPGTGLGEAGLYWDGEYYHPFATEGGHADFAPRDGFDFELYQYLQQQLGHVSWERLVCGPGIVNIYRFLRDEKKMEEPQWLVNKMKNADIAAAISTHVKESKLCGETMRLFIRYLAHESANLVLKLNATGGLFIGGGIAPKNKSLFQQNAFYASFRQSGRLNYLLEKVPVKIILNTKAALLGARYYAATR